MTAGVRATPAKNGYRQITFRINVRRFKSEVQQCGIDGMAE
jgi:hypothetical protein